MWGGLLYVTPENTQNSFATKSSTDPTDRFASEVPRGPNHDVGKRCMSVCTKHQAFTLLQSLSSGRQGGDSQGSSLTALAKRIISPCLMAASLGRGRSEIRPSPHPLHCRVVQRSNGGKCEQSTRSFVSGESMQPETRAALPALFFSLLRRAAAFLDVF